MTLSDHTGHDGMSMPMPMGDPDQTDSSHMRMLLADEKGSELNPHLAGIFVLLAGLFIIVQDTLPRRWPFFRLAWPACFLLSGLFLLVYSDKELWPFGSQSWWYGLSHS